MAQVLLHRSSKQMKTLFYSKARSMSDLTYRCPLCHEPVKVAAAQVGGRIDCPHCNRAIEIEAPKAELIEGTDLDDGTADRVASPLDSEEMLRVVHPVMFRAHPFWFILLFGCFVAGLIVAAGGGFFEFPWERSLGWILGGVLVVIGGLGLIVWWLKTRTLTLEVTSKRTRLIRGFIAKKTSEVQHDDVRNIQVDQSMVGRLVNVGGLAVSSSGQDDLEINAKGLPGPNEIAELIRDRQ